MRNCVLLALVQFEFIAVEGEEGVHILRLVTTT
jgi:hypothetical protein